MGMFSWDCKGCGFSIRERAGWMGKAVAMTERGSRIIGEYDGYGRIDDMELSEDGSFSLWHHACWKVAGKPEYSGNSRGSDDQGFPGCDREEPKTVADMEALRKTADFERAEERRKWKRHMELSEQERAIVNEKCHHCGFDRAFVVTFPDSPRLAARCSSRECEKLRELSEETQAALRAFRAANPDHEFWTDDEVSPEGRARRAKEAEEKQRREEEELEKRWAEQDAKEELQ